MSHLPDPRALSLVSEDEQLEELIHIFHSFAVDSGSIFQVDFIKEGTTVIRVRTGPRAWKKIASGNWDTSHLTALIGRGLIVKNSGSSMGWEISPRPELLGSL